MNSENKKARIVKASRMLQAKVGTGPVDEKKVALSQKLIDENDVDFVPLAEEFIAELQQTIEEAKKGEKPGTKLIPALCTPVMQIKANAAMFNYSLVSSLANVILNFLETIEDIDDDVIEIIEAHQKTLVLLIDNNMKGDGGAFGKELVDELKEACKRYFAKQASAGKTIDDKDAFFIDS